LKRILEIAKYIGAITVIGGASLWFDGVGDSVKENVSIIMDTISVTNDKIQRIYEDFNDQKKVTNTYRNHEAEQTDEFIKEIKTLQRNQRAIISKSTEQKDILEEIQNMQLINGVVELEYIKPILPDKLVYR